MNNINYLKHSNKFFYKLKYKVQSSSKDIEAIETDINTFEFNSNEDLSVSYLPTISMNSYYFDTFKIKFIENNYDCCIAKISLEM